MAWLRVGWVGLVIASCLLAGCGSPVREPEAGPVPVWPAAPDEPRITYVRSIRAPDDLGIAKGLLAQLGDLVFGRTEDRLVRPMAVVEAGGMLYVADPGARGVHRFDSAHGKYDLVSGPDGAALPSPVGLAKGTGGEIYVADSKLAQILLIEPGGREARPLRLAAPLSQPTGISFDAAARRLVVVDTGAHCLRVFDAEGALVETIGRRGQGAGEFNFPTHVWWSAPDRLYVTDALNFRVQILSGRGLVLGGFGRHGDGSGDLSLQKGVATDRFGHVYVVDSHFHAVQVFDEGGRFLLSVGGLGQAPGEFWLPTGIFIGDDDQIYVADSYNQRIQVFRYIGGGA